MKLDERRKTDMRGFQSSIRLLREDMKTVVHQMYKVREDVFWYIHTYIYGFILIISHVHLELYHDLNNYKQCT